MLGHIIAPNDQPSSDKTPTDKPSLDRPRKLSFRETLVSDILNTQHTPEHSFGEYYGDSYKDNEEEEDDNGCSVILFSKGHFLCICEPWKDALIIKLLGCNLGHSVIAQQLKYQWKPKGMITMSDVGNYFYVVWLSIKANYKTTIFEGSWLISDHYLTVQRWNPNFDAEPSTVMKLLVWIRILKIPMYCFDKDFLTDVGSHFGRVLQVDETTYTTAKGIFCVS